MLLLLACTASAPDETGTLPEEVAVFQGTCGPTDGAALELRIGVDQAGCDAVFTGPSIKLDFWNYGYPPREASYSFDSGRGDGMGLWMEDSAGSLTIPLVHGEISISSQEDDGYHGQYTVTQEDDAVRTGRFLAGGCDTAPICG